MAIDTADVLKQIADDAEDAEDERDRKMLGDFYVQLQEWGFIDKKLYDHGPCVSRFLKERDSIDQEHATFAGDRRSLFAKLCHEKPRRLE